MKIIVGYSPGLFNDKCLNAKAAVSVSEHDPSPSGFLISPSPIVGQQDGWAEMHLSSPTQGTTLRAETALFTRRGHCLTTGFAISCFASQPDYFSTAWHDIIHIHIIHKSCHQFCTSRGGLDTELYIHWCFALQTEKSKYYADVRLLIKQCIDSDVLAKLVFHYITVM